MNSNELIAALEAAPTSELAMCVRLIEHELPNEMKGLSKAMTEGKKNDVLIAIRAISGEIFAMSLKSQNY